MTTHRLCVREPYFSMIKNEDKTYEGRLASKIASLGLEVGHKLVFIHDDDTIIAKITSLKTYRDFGLAFDELGDSLMPKSTRKETVSIYNDLYHYPDENVNILSDQEIPSMMIIDEGAVAIGFEVNHIFQTIRAFSDFKNRNPVV